MPERLKQNRRRGGLHIFWVIVIIAAITYFYFKNKKAEEAKQAAAKKQEEDMALRLQQEHWEAIKDAIYSRSEAKWAKACDDALNEVDRFPTYNGYIAYWMAWDDHPMTYKGRRYPDLYGKGMWDAVERKMKEREAREEQAREAKFKMYQR